MKIFLIQSISFTKKTTFYADNNSAGLVKSGIKWVEKCPWRTKKLSIPQLFCLEYLMITLIMISHGFSKVSLAN